MPARQRSDWKERAGRLATVLPPARLHPAALRWAEKNPPGAPWSVAFSGGADSLALLLLLWAHWPERRRTLRALHFNHRLRGRAAEADAVFCRGVCVGLGVKFISAAWTAARKGASEAEARAARHAFFERHSRALWLGHQQDDIAETMLMRLARGSGAGGLSAPRPVQPRPGDRVHVRPLLTLKKSEITAALRASGIPWREDRTNAGGDYFRNRVRRDVVPAWIDAAQRDALGGAAQARELLEEDDAALDAWVTELKPLTKRGVLSLAKLSGKPRALLRRALHRWLLAHPASGDLSRQGFEALLDSLQRNRETRHSLGREGFAVIRNGALTFKNSGKSERKFQRRAN